MVYKHELLVIAVIMIIIGAVIWAIDFPLSAEAASDAIGQVVFWIGIILLIIWAIMIAIYYVRTEAKKP
ncbi:MAG TPA: hypothetical protein VGE97_01950 [Nitrososphaera sp.]